MTTKETEKVYVTKYALTAGIQLVDVDVPRITEDPYRYSKERFPVQYGRGDWFHTFAEALANAEERKAARIASLKRSLAKVEKLKFPEPGAA